MKRDRDRGIATITSHGHDHDFGSIMRRQLFFGVVILLLDRKGVELVISRLTRTKAKAKGQTPETLRVFEPSILEEIKKSGFVEKARK